MADLMIAFLSLTGLFLAGICYRTSLRTAAADTRRAWQAAAEAEHRVDEWRDLALARARDLADWQRRAVALGRALRRLGYSAQEVVWSDGDITYRITYVGTPDNPPAPEEVTFHD